MCPKIIARIRTILFNYEQILKSTMPKYVLKHGNQYWYKL